MTKQEAQAELEALEKRKEELQAIINKAEFDPERFLKGIFNDYVSKTDRKKYPDVIFFGFDKEGNYLFEYDEKINVFWLSYARIWNVFVTETNWNYHEIQSFTKKIVEEHFKLKEVTTNPCITRLNLKWKSTLS